MGRGISLGRIAGIEIRLDWSLLIIFALITGMLGAAVFPSWHPDWSPALSWLTALAAAVLFLVSVLLHEMSHALVGRYHGMEVNRITLFIFGGMAHLEEEAKHWRAEFWMAIVGPITSLVIGVVFIWIAGALGAAEIDPAQPQEGLARLGPIATLLLWVGPVNIILAIFNLVPGFPLDGGRVMRSLLWGITGDLYRATRWASRLGQAFAWLLIAMGVAMILGIRVPIFGTGLIGGLWLTLIGWFLNTAAIASYQQLIAQHSLRNVPVRKLMDTDLRPVAPGLTLEQFFYEHLLHSDQRAFPVIEDERLVGLLYMDDVRRSDREHWPSKKVRELMTPADRLTSIDPETDAAEAMERLSQGGLDHLPVIDNGRLLGLVRRQDLIRWLSLRQG